MVNIYGMSGGIRCIVIIENGEESYMVTELANCKFTVRAEAGVWGQGVTTMEVEGTVIEQKPSKESPAQFTDRPEVERKLKAIKS